MGAPEHLRAEIGRFRIAASDMRQAARGAGHLAGIRAGEVDRMHGDADRALETGAIISYARPFTKQGIGQLDKAEWTPSDDDRAKLHGALIRLRNIRYAHTDRTELRGTEDVFGTCHYSEAWVSLHDDAWSRIEQLADEQALAMDSLADRLQAVLAAE